MSGSDHWIFETDEAVQEVDGNPRPPVPSGMVGDPGSPSKSKAPISIAVWSAAIWFAIVTAAVIIEYFKGNTTGGLEIGRTYLFPIVSMAVGWVYGRGSPGR